MSPLFSELRFLDHRDTPADGAWNMAFDEVLLRCSDSGDSPLLRLYAWDRPTLSFGYFLNYADAVAAAGPDEPVIRRWTGGGMVHHGQDLTWSLMVPASHPFSRVRPMESYGLLHQAAAAALEASGIGPAQVVGPAAPAPRGGLCFEAPAPGDLLLNGRKIAGAGQRRTRQGLLHQASLCLPDRRPPDGLGAALARELAWEYHPWQPPPDLNIPRNRYAGTDWLMRL
ncbi:MAG: lipoate-protein ligase [Verrucomicrobiales bacterium]|nr:lipoate-protein ligase [Verrucomicrobiales bacterium]